jgi:hypothetical protein
MDFAKFNKAVDLDTLKKGVEECAKNNTEFEEVPFGKYEVKLEKCELVECKSEANKGQPMMSIWFKITAGNQKNRLIFMNQLVNSDFKIHIANEFLRSLDSGVNVGFDDYVQFGNMLMDILEASEKTGFVLDYFQNSKGFKSYKIVEVFDI